MLSGFVFSGHALKKLRERELDESLAEEILAAPEQCFPDNKGLMIYQSRVQLPGGTYLLRLFVNEETSPKRVVTIYLTSKLRKYWRA